MDDEEDQLLVLDDEEFKLFVFGDDDDEAYALEVDEAQFVFDHVEDNRAGKVDKI